MGPMGKRSRTLALVAALGLVVALVATALLVLSTPESDDRVAAREPAAERAALAPAAPAELEASAPQPASEPAPAPLPVEPERERRAQPADPALADAIWVRGVVAFPEGTPADERVTITARGRAFRDRDERYHSAEVAPDGAFRVAFAPRTTKGRLTLDARYVRLADGVRLELDELEEPVVLEVELGGRIEGRLVLPDGAAVPEGLEVSAHAQNIDTISFSRRALVDAELRFALDGIVAGVSYQIECDPAMFAPAETEALVKAGETTVVELSLPRGARVEGRVVDGEGAPVEGAAVSVRFDGRRRTTSDAAGRFALAGIAPGPARVSAVVEGAMPVTVELEPLEDGAVIGDLEIVVGVGLALRGLVRWPDGAPAAGVRVVASERSSGGHAWGLIELGAQTDDAGRFEIAGLEAKRFDVSARAEPRAEDLGPDAPRRPQEWTALVSDVAAGQDVVLELGRGLVLRGRVVDDRGQPVERFRIQAAEETEQAHWLARFGAELSHAFRDADGAFELKGLTPGRWRVIASAAQHADSAALVVDVPGAVATWRVPRLASISGRVEDGAGNPVADARVTATAVGGDPTSSFMSSFITELGGGERTADDGTFEMRGVEPRSQRLVAQADGFAPSEPLVLAVVPGEELADVVLVVGAQGVIEGVARGFDGAAAAGQTVVLHEAEGDPSRGSSWPPMPQGYQQTRVASDGTFRFESLAAGRYALVLQAPDGEGDDAAATEAWAQLHGSVLVVLAPGETARVELGAGAKTVGLAGTVRIGGEASAGVTVSVERVDGVGFEAETTTDDAGRYALELNGPGAFRVRVDADGASVERSLVVPAVDEHRFDVDVAAGAIAGVVRDLGGRPLADVPVDITGDGLGASSSGRATTGADGRWSASPLEPGTYVVRVAGRGASSEAPAAAHAWRSNVVVRAGETTEDIDFALGPPAVLTGRVVDANGAPVQSAGLRVRGADGRLDSGWRGASDAQGRFRIDDLAAGEVVLLAATMSGLTTEGRPVELHAGASTDVELVVRAGAWLEVHGRDAADRAIPMRVHVTDEQGRDWGFVATWWMSIAMPPSQAFFGFRSAMRPEPLPEQRFGPLPRGRYVVRAMDGTGRVAEREVTLGDAPEERVVLRFE